MCEKINDLLNENSTLQMTSVSFLLTYGNKNQLNANFTHYICNSIYIEYDRLHSVITFLEYFSKKTIGKKVKLLDMINVFF
jgi:hypothetical protein